MCSYEIFTNFKKLVYKLKYWCDQFPKSTSIYSVLACIPVLGKNIHILINYEIFRSRNSIAMILNYLVTLPSAVTFERPHCVLYP